MKKIAVIGYASIDYPAVLDGFFQGDQTVMIKQRPTDAFPRPGGCPLYVARPIAAVSDSVSIITWVGDDDHGDLFRSYAARDGVRTEGIATIKSGQTPVCFVIYQQDGSCCCCFDSGMLGREVLSDEQKQLVEEAELLCVTVGPPDIGKASLSRISDSCKVAWVAKNDPLSYPVEYREQLGARADYIFCNQQERKWIDGALEKCGRKPALIVETNGGNPVTVNDGRQKTMLDVPPLQFDDASGAGDTLAGGCLKAIADGEVDATLIARSGITASTELLKQRSCED